MQKDGFEIESFPDLSRFRPQSAVVRPLRICIATEEIFGPVRNGGIASTYYHLARTLAGDGHDVTVLYLKGRKCENETIEHWIAFYAGLGIKFVPLEGESLPLSAPALFWQSRYYDFYRWLRLQPAFDVVHTSEWRGGAYYVLHAKRQGLAFRDTLFLVKSSSPWIWNRHYTMRTVENDLQLVCMFAERRTLELADMVIGGSAHLLNFMRHKGYRLPEGRTFVQPNIIDLQNLGIEEKRPDYAFGDKVKSNELVFFGRLEGRKGLEIFCDAIDRLLEQGVSIEAVTFMGKEGRNLPSHPHLGSLQYIAAKAKAWPIEVKVIDNYDQDKAIGYLCEKPRIAVMPSIIENSTMAVYECLVHKIPFIATDSGGTPELIDPAHRAETLVPPHPEPLAAALARVLDEGATVAKGAFSYEENLEIWRSFHRYLGERLAETGSAAAVLAGIGGAALPAVSSAPRPRVSVCVYHCDRPGFLEALADALAAQEEAPHEVIVLTDGKPKPAVRERLDALARRFAGAGWRFVETPHRCIGPAFNEAAAQATGDVLAFLHAERHVPKPAFVATLATAAASSPAAAFAFFHDRFGDDPKPAAAPLARVLPMGGDLATGFFIDGAYSGGCFAVRRDAFVASGGFADMYHIAGVEDELLARLQLSGNDVEIVPEPLYWERQVKSRIAFNGASGDYLRIRPFLERAPYFQEATLMLAREQHMRLKKVNAEAAALRNANAGLVRERDKLRKALALHETGGALARLNGTANRIVGPVYREARKYVAKALKIARI